MKRLISGPWVGLHRFALADGAIVFCAAVTVLIGGWGWDVAAIREPLQGFSAMKANTSIGLAALGLSLSLAQFASGTRLWCALPAGIATVLGALTLLEYACGWDLRIDQLLFPDRSTAVFPGRPAALTALLLVLLGTSLLCSEAGRSRHLRTFCALAALLVTWTLLNGYLFGHLAPPPSVPPFGIVAVHTAGGFLLIAFGVLAAQPSSWPVSTIVDGGISGVVCRALLPAAVFAPPLLGWLLGDTATLSDHRMAFHWALYSVFSSVGSIGLILVLARWLAIMDLERRAATRLSRHDGLTELANRRAFDDFLLESFSLARRLNRPLSLVTLDVDNFKTYNDTYGHPAGDEVLRSIGKVLLGVVRETDLVARIGGEEFALVLPEADASGARATAERLRNEVAALRTLRRPVTVSIGIATLTGNVSTAAALLKESDLALYSAKQSGRNRIAEGPPAR